MARTPRSADLPSESDPPTGRKARKAARKARKADKTPWYKQIWQVFQMTRQAEPLIWLWMLAVLVGVVGLFALFGLTVWKGRAVYMSILGAPFGFLGMLVLLVRRAERAAYSRIEGEEGASLAAIKQIRRGFTFEEDPVAIDPRSRVMVFRGVGRPGVILVTDGQTGGRLEKMVEAETRKVNRVAPDIPVRVFWTGSEKGQVPLRKLARTIQRQRPKITKAEVGVVLNRLKALGGVGLPIPKGIDPLRVRPDRKALRGR